MTVSYTDLAEQFLCLEKENHLFDLKIKGHLFWEFIRYYVFEEINRAKSQVQFPTKKWTYFQKIWELIQYGTYRLKLLIQRPKKFDVLLLTHTRTAEIDGKKVYFHTYPLAKILSKAFKVMIAHRHEFPISKSDYPCPVLITRPIFLISRLRSYFIQFSAEEKSIFARLSALINNVFNANINIDALARHIYRSQLACYREFSVFFKTYKPSVIIYCDSGEMKPVLKAAHEAGIRTIDYQHGIISRSNLLYRYSEGFDSEKLKETNADYIFTFGDYWTSFFTTPSLPVSVGFPYFDLCRPKSLSNESDKNILITSVLSSRRFLAQLAIDLADRLPDYTIYYRRRTEEHDLLQSIYPQEFTRKKNIKVIGSQDSSLYENFSKCRYLISTNSMTLYEGIASGLTTFVLKAGWYDEVEDLYQKGYARLVSSAKEIVAAIKDKESSISPAPMDHLFKKNSLSHVESFLNNLLVQ